MLGGKNTLFIGYYSHLLKIALLKIQQQIPYYIHDYEYQIYFYWRLYILKKAWNWATISWAWAYAGVQLVWIRYVIARLHFISIHWVGAKWFHHNKNTYKKGGRVRLWSVFINCGKIVKLIDPKAWDQDSLLPCALLNKSWAGESKSTLLMFWWQQKLALPN